MTFNNTPISQENEIEPKHESFSDRFNKVASRLKTEETDVDFLKRNASQHAARTAEVIVGLPGNTKRAVTEMRKMVPNLLGLPDLGELEKKMFGEPEKGSWNELYATPPTSNELREKVTPKVAEKLGLEKDYFEPRSEGEKWAGELNQDIISSLLPGTGRFNLLKNIGGPILANLSKSGLKYIGLSDENAEKAKLGIMFTTSLASQSNPAQFARDRIAQAKSMIPNGMTVFTNNFRNELNTLRTRLNRGLGVPSKSKTIQGINELELQIDNNGRIPMQNLMQARDDINQWISEAGGWDIPADVREPTLVNLNRLKRNIIDTIDNNLTTRLPQVGEMYRTGYEAAAVTHQSNAVSNFIQKNYGKKVASAATKVVFPALVTGGAVLPKTAIGTAALLPAYKTGQILYRVYNSPTLARYYRDVITASLQSNAPAMVYSMQKFDKAMKEEEDKMDKGKKLSLSEFKQRFTNRD